MRGKTSLKNELPWPLMLMTGSSHPSNQSQTMQGRSMFFLNEETHLKPHIGRFPILI